MRNDTERLPPHKALAALVIMNLIAWGAISGLIVTTRWLWRWLVP